MKIPWWLHNWLLLRVDRHIARPPDQIIGGVDDPYLYRWYIIPRNRVFNIYAHAFFRSDDDRALHDHPWVSASIILEGNYLEHTIAAGGIHRRALRQAGHVYARGARTAHRVELHGGWCLTLFLTGPRYRDWYFHCPEQGLVHWRDFTVPGDEGTIGKGCEQ